MRRGLDDFLRFYGPLALFMLMACAACVRLFMLHLDLVSKRPRTPKYEYKKLSQGQRGTIFSSCRPSVALAKTTTMWDYRLDPQAATNDPKFVKRPISPAKRMEKMTLVSKWLDLPLPKVMDAYANLRKRNQFLASSDDHDVHDFFMARTNYMHEIKIVERQTRVYPQGRTLSHVLGFVNHDPDNSVGGAGIELKYEKYLKGTRGEVRSVRDACGREDPLRRGLDIDAIPGCDVYLTIDHNLQYELEKILREGIVEHRAAHVWAIVLSVKTGAVLAMACLPDYDPVNFNQVSEEAKKNLAISECYEPGSVMKTITACACLEEKLVGPDTMIDTSRNDPEFYRLPGDAGHVWDDRMSVRDSLVHSSNIVFGKLGVRLGPKRLYGYMTAFGLGRRTGIELPGEECGIIPPWERWDKVKWSRAPIGQGVAVTAIQLASAYAAIANDGELMRPYIVERIVQHDGTVVYSHAPTSLGHPISATTSRQVRQMMLGVAKKGGTAKRAAVPGYSVAGKTGTAQMKNPDGRGYSSVDYNASFIGIIPAAKPEVVILVTYQKPFYCRSRSVAEAQNVPLFNHQGGLCAAPTFSRIAERTMRYLAIEPDIPDEVPEDDEL